MGTPADKKDEIGPSWYDVRERWNDYEKVHRRRLKLEVSLQSTQGGKLTLWCRYEWRAAGVSGDKPADGYLGAGFPNEHHKTLPGLLYGLLFRLCLDADNAAAQAERQAHF